MPTTTTIEKPTAEPSSELSPSDEENVNRLADKYKDIPFDDSRVLKYGEPNASILRAKATEIGRVDTEIRSLVREMGDIMYTAHGVGLAAPQVGQSIRLLVYDAGNGLQALINPVLLKAKGEQYEPEEGCLSIPGLRGVVQRAQEIQVRAQDAEGRPVRLRVSGFEARVILHEIDHLDGILFIDRADPTTLHMLPNKTAQGEHVAADNGSGDSVAE